MVFCGRSVKIVFNVSSYCDDTGVDTMGEALEVTSEDVGYGVEIMGNLGKSVYEVLFGDILWLEDNVFSVIL